MTIRTNYNEVQFKRILKMAIEKGISIGKQGEGKGWFFKKTDDEVAHMHLDAFCKDIECLYQEAQNNTEK